MEKDNVTNRPLMRGSEIISYETLKSGLTTALTNSILSVSRKKKGLPRLSDTGRTKTRRQRDVEISRNAYIGVCATINGRCFYVNPVLSKLSVWKEQADEKKILENSMRRR